MREIKIVSITWKCKNFILKFVKLISATSVCRGDSGSGLLFENDGTWTIGGITSLGISSAGSDQCDLTQYVLFTEVSKYVDWIDTTLQF